MSENNSDKAPKGTGLQRSEVAGNAERWREAVRTWLDIDQQEDWGEDGSEQWTKCEGRWTECLDRLLQATRQLAARMATQGVDVASLNELARMCGENADEWLDRDSGEGKRLSAIAAAERLLQNFAGCAGKMVRAPAEAIPAPKPLGRTEKWILDVLRQEPDRSFEIKDLLSGRRRRDQAPCPVGRSAMCESLAQLRGNKLVTYVKRSYMHKK